MSGISSMEALSFDTSSEGLRGATRDVGTVLAWLSGGWKPEGSTVVQMLGSLRQIQGFLQREAEEAAGREEILKALGDVAPSNVPTVSGMQTSFARRFRDPDAAQHEDDLRTPADLFDEIRAQANMLAVLASGIDAVEARFRDDDGDIDALLRMSRACTEELHWRGRKLSDLFVEAESLGVADALSAAARQLPVAEIGDAAS